MKWLVFWQPGDECELAWFKTEVEAREKVDAVALANEEDCDEGRLAFWDITLLKVVGEVYQVPFDGRLILKEVLSHRGETMNRYCETLKDCAKRMSGLADKLASQRAQPLTKDERASVRLAMLPMMREMLDESLAQFAAGQDAENSKSTLAFLQLARDLKG